MFGVTDHFVNVQSPDEPTTPFDPSFLFRYYVFTISAIADFDDAARREATANANQTRVDERKSIYSQYLRVRVVVRAPSAPRRAAPSKLGVTIFSALYCQGLYQYQ